jgi:hypothetical protein
MLTEKQRKFINNRLDGKQIDRTRNKTMIRKRLEDRFIPLPELADTFINDFDLLCTYFKSEPVRFPPGSMLGTLKKSFVKDLIKNFSLEQIKYKKIEKTVKGMPVIIERQNNAVLLTIDNTFEIRLRINKNDEIIINDLEANPLNILLESLIKKYGKEKIMDNLTHHD